MCDRVLNHEKEQVHKVTSNHKFSWEGLSQEKHDATIDQGSDIDINGLDNIDGLEDDYFFSMDSFDMGELRLDQPLDVAKVQPSV